MTPTYTHKTQPLCQTQQKTHSSTDCCVALTLGVFRIAEFGLYWWEISQHAYNVQRRAGSAVLLLPLSLTLFSPNREITASVTRLTLRNQNKVRSVTLERFWHGSLFGACAAISNNRCTWKRVRQTLSVHLGLKKERKNYLIKSGGVFLSHMFMILEEVFGKKRFCQDNLSKLLLFFHLSNCCLL